MTTINLKDLYYWYTQDQLIEVFDEVAEVFKAVALQKNKKQIENRTEK